MVANGKVPDEQLEKVQGDLRLAAPTAKAWRHLVAEAKEKLDRTIRIAEPGGAYRSLAAQKSMHDAGAGHDRAAKTRWGLNPNSVVAIAAPGYSTHGLGNAVDIVGTVIDEKFLDLAKKHGFTRTFGPRDPNHFGHA